MMIPVRIFFEKTGRAKYTSHLDTMRTMTRAFKRSGLKLWYTEGFNPHLYCTFTLPIALGYESVCESVDVRLTEETGYETIVRALNAALPLGLRVLRAAAPVMEPAAIALADYRVTLRYPEEQLAGRLDKLETLLRQPVIEVTKRTKKGDRQLDIRPHVTLISCERAPGALELTLRMAAGNTLNINPTLFLKAFYEWDRQEPDGVRIVRTGIYTEKMEIFC